MPDQSFTGSCTCGFIKYSLTLTPEFLSNPIAGRCNCTICQKGGYNTIQVNPSAFTLISPASKSELPDFQPNIKTTHLYFCPKCGVQVYRDGYYEHEGKTIEHFTVNLVTLDQPQEGLDLRKVKFHYWNMLNDDMTSGSRDEPWEGGCL